MLARRDIPLIEDDIYGDLHHDGARPRPARAFDRNGLVMLCGSFSKTLAPGTASDTWRPGASATRSSASSSRRPSRRRRCRRWPSPTSSRTAATSGTCGGCGARCRAGGEGERGHRRPTSRRARASRARAAGFLLWVEMPPGKSALELHDRALARGVSVAPGPIFSAKRPLLELHAHQLRLSLVRGHRAGHSHARRHSARPMNSVRARDARGPSWAALQRSSTMAYTRSRGCPSRS